MPKYIIEIPEDRVTSDGKLRFMACVDSPLANWVYTGIFAEPFDRKAIEDEVWEFVKMLEHETCVGDLVEMYKDEDEIYMNYTYQEAKAQYESWKKYKSIRVGDEVEMDYSIDKTIKGIVLDKMPGEDDDWVVFTENGCVEEYEANDLTKTGKHFNVVEKLLNMMRQGDSDE